MKNALLYTLLIVLSLLQYGCNDFNNEKIVQKKYNEKGTLVYEQEFIKIDTGILMDGFCRYYYDDGQLKMQEFFHRGKRDGFFYKYFKSGCIEQKVHVVEDSLLGSFCIYGSNCNIKYFYNYINTEKASFGVRYDTTNGSVFAISGHPLSVKIENPKNVYTVSDTVLISNVLAIPNKIVDTLMVTYHYDNGSTFVDKISNIHYIESLDMHYIKLPYLCSKGSGRYTAILNLHDSVSKKLIAVDSLSFHINVK